jgi:GNAT superfamily N-acetyltransferase
MLELKEVDFNTVSPYFVDFQKKSKNYDMPSEDSQNIGIFINDELAGYYIIKGYDNTDVEICHGYLRPEFRHLGLLKQCMPLLETKCKQAGYKNMLLATGSRFKAYLKIAMSLGYKPEHLEFRKNIED